MRTTSRIISKDNAYLEIRELQLQSMEEGAPLSSTCLGGAVWGGRRGLGAELRAGSAAARAELRAERGAAAWPELAGRRSAARLEEQEAGAPDPFFAGGTGEEAAIRSCLPF